MLMAPLIPEKHSHIIFQNLFQTLAIMWCEDPNVTCSALCVLKNDRSSFANCSICLTPKYLWKYRSQCLHWILWVGISFFPNRCFTTAAICLVNWFTGRSSVFIYNIKALTQKISAKKKKKRKEKRKIEQEHGTPLSSSGSSSVCQLHFLA